MPKLECLCGETINLSAIPNSQGFELVWEPAVEPLMDDMVAAHRQATSEKEFESQAYRSFHLRGAAKPRFTQIYECPHCGRLAVMNEEHREVALWFKRERERIGEDTADSLVELEGQKQPASENQMIAPIEPHRPAPTTYTHNGGDVKMESTVTPEELLAGAESFIQLVRENLGVELAYDEQSVAWVDGYIERVGQELLKQGKADGPMGAIGSFLGECIRRNFGGKWAQVDGRWAIRFERDTGLGAAYPFSNVRKQFEDGHRGGQSILGFYKTIPVLLAYDKL